jgi:hypothetical protein
MIEKIKAINNPLTIIAIFCRSGRSRWNGGHTLGNARITIYFYLVCNGFALIVSYLIFYHVKFQSKSSLRSK